MCSEWSVNVTRAQEWIQIGYGRRALQRIHLICPVRKYFHLGRWKDVSGIVNLFGENRKLYQVQCDSCLNQKIKSNSDFCNVLLGVRREKSCLWSTLPEIGYLQKAVWRPCRAETSQARSIPSTAFWLIWKICSVTWKPSHLVLRQQWPFSVETVRL